MIYNLCRRLKNEIEVRKSLSQLRQEIKDSTNKEMVISWLLKDGLDLSHFLQNDDAKTRKNAALLIGDLNLSSYADNLFQAYEKEKTLFVKEAYLRATLPICCQCLGRRNGKDGCRGIG